MQTNYMGMTITEVFYGGALVSLPLLWALAALPLLRRRMARPKDLRAMVLLPVLLAVILAALDCQMAGVLYRYLSDWLRPAAAGGAGVALCGRCPAGPPHPRADQSSAHGAAAGRAGGRLLQQFLCLLCGEPQRWAEPPCMKM